MLFFDILTELKVIPEQAMNAVIFDATAVAKQLDMAVSEVGTYPAEFYGLVAPPFTERFFFVEASTVPMAGYTVRRGALCLAHDYEGEHGDWYPKETGLEHEAPRWLVEVRAFRQMDEGDKPYDIDTVIVPDATAYIFIGQDGHMLTDPSKVFVTHDTSDKDMARAYAKMTTNTIPFTMLAVSFLHRRTVVEHVKPNRMARKRAARLAGQKHGAKDLRDYYLVRVAPHEEGAGIMPDDIQPARPMSGTKQAHSVRGHFRRVPDSGLFGRGTLAGQLLWIPDHTRGTGDTARQIYKLVE